MGKHIVEQLPFFKGYVGNDALIDTELFSQWLEHERTEETLTPEEAAQCDAAWAEYQRNPELAQSIEDVAQELGIVLQGQSGNVED